MQVIVRNYRERYNEPRYRQNKKRLARVFIDDVRPFNRGDIFGDLNWRRKVNYSDIAKNKDFREKIAEYFKYDVKELSFRFDRYCGCNICPCSPGITVSLKEAIPFDFKDEAIWVAVQ